MTKQTRTNSLIGENRVVNYAKPDPTLNIRTDIGVAYGTDMGTVRRVAVEAVRGVEGVLPDKPVNVYFVAYRDAARQMRVVWWIDSIHSKYLVLDRVNEALEQAFAAAGIELPFPTYKLNIKMD